MSQGLIDAGLRIGDTLAVDRSTVTFEVVGAAPPATYGHVDAVYVNLGDWQRVSHRYAGGGDDVSAVAIRGGDPGSTHTGWRRSRLGCRHAHRGVRRITRLPLPRRRRCR